MSSVLSQFIQLWRRLLFYLRRDQFDRELTEEMQFHLKLKEEENLRAGMKPTEARAVAQRQFGNQTLLQEVSREMWGFRSIETLLQDLRYGVRLLLKNKGFTAVAALSLALGIGANTALFSLVDAVLLKMLPVKEPNRLVLLRWLSGPKRMPRAVNGEFNRNEATGAQTSTSFSFLIFEQLRARNQTLANIFAFTDIGQLNVNVGGQAEFASGQRVSGGYYAGLGVQMMVGRSITDDDDKAAAAPVAVISHRYWQNRFGLDPAIVGKTIKVNNTPATIIGVTPPEFRGTLQVGSNPDLSLPLVLEPTLVAGRRAEPWQGKPWNWWLPIIGRLKPGVRVEQARADLEAIFQRSALEGYQAMP